MSAEAKPTVSDASEQAVILGPDGKPLSKNQLKKLQKEAELKEKKAAKEKAAIEKKVFILRGCP